MNTGRLKELNPISETMLISLGYRAAEARRPDALFRDPRAQEIIDRLGIDQSRLGGRPFQQVFAMLRARQYDRWAQDFLARHPGALVVEIGCGLDARFERIDDGLVNWIDMDLPEVIALRRQFF